MKRLILLSILLALGACGEGNEAADSGKAAASAPQKAKPAKAGNGKVSFKALSKETVEKHGGIISECHITFEVVNGLGSNIDRACVKFDLVTNENAAYDVATNIKGTQKICGRNIKERSRETVIEEITTAGCDEISALQVVSFECFDDAKNCSAEAYAINGNNIITVRN